MTTPTPDDLDYILRQVLAVRELGLALADSDLQSITRAIRYALAGIQINSGCSNVAARDEVQRLQAIIDWLKRTRPTVSPELQGEPNGD